MQVLWCWEGHSLLAHAGKVRKGSVRHGRVSMRCSLMVPLRSGLAISGSDRRVGQRESLCADSLFVAGNCVTFIFWLRDRNFDRHQSNCAEDHWKMTGQSADRLGPTVQFVDVTRFDHTLSKHQMRALWTSTFPPESAHDSCVI